jgi:predicted peroxiredoxin
MGKLLYVGTYGTDDPTRASMPFVATLGALDRGHEAGIVLMGEAVYLLKGEVADQVHGVGYRPLRRLLEETIEANVPIYVGSSCAKAREVTQSDLAGMNAQITHASDLADLMLAHDRVLSF